MPKEVMAPAPRPFKKYGKSAEMADYLSFKKGIRELKKAIRVSRMAKRTLDRADRKIKILKRKLVNSI